MNNNSFRYAFRVAGIDRKAVAKVIGEAIEQESIYTGAPKFFYRTGGWVVNREGMVITPDILIKDRETMRPVFDALKSAGATAEENRTVAFSLEGHSGNTLRNCVNLIWSKQSLLEKALGLSELLIPENLVNVLNSVEIDTLEDFSRVVNDTIDAGEIAGDCDLDFDLAEMMLSFSFSNASLDFDEVTAFITLCWQISEQAKQQKFSSTKQKNAENERYALRCYLLKLGFIGEEFKQSRKILLSKLSGSSAFRTIEAQQAAQAKRKASVLTERSEN